MTVESAPLEAAEAHHHGVDCCVLCEFFCSRQNPYRGKAVNWDHHILQHDDNVPVSSFTVIKKMTPPPCNVNVMLYPSGGGGDWAANKYRLIFLDYYLSLTLIIPKVMDINTKFMLPSVAPPLDVHMDVP